MLIDFLDSDFESKVKNEDVSILQFSASWCGPCKVLKPIMEKLSDEFKDKANFYYADIDEKAINSASAAAVRGVPTVVVYKKGVEVARKVGGLPEQQMRDFLKKFDAPLDRSKYSSYIHYIDSFFKKNMGPKDFTIQDLQKRLDKQDTKPSTPANMPTTGYTTVGGGGSSGGY